MSEKIVSFESEWVGRGFTQFWNVVLLNGHLSPGARMLWATLAHYARQENTAWPGQERIAVTLGASERSIRTYLRELEDCGLVSTQRRIRQTNLYVMHDPSPAYIADLDRQILPVSAAESAGEKKKQTEEDADRRKQQAAGAADAEPGTLFAPPEAQVPPSDDESTVQAVWDYYFAKLGEHLTLKVLTDARKKRIRAALRAADDNVEILCKAVDGFIRYRSRKPGKYTLDDVFSSRPGGSSLTELIEFWCSQADDSPTMSATVPSALRDKVNRRRLQIVEALKLPDDSAARERAREAVDWLKTNANEAPVIEGGVVVRWERVT